MLWLYALILLVVAVALWAAYRVLGTPSKLRQDDYSLVVADLAATVERSAGALRDALEGPEDRLEETASGARKIFQTGYYQTLRLRPASGRDALQDARAELGRACEAYDWASRMVSSESLHNPLVREAALRLLDAGDQALRTAALRLPASQPGPRERTAPSL
jgi:hypothetical protein